MRDRLQLSHAAIFAAMWVALSALVMHDIYLRHHGGGTTVSDKIVTKEFTLVDDSGTTRARIGMSEKNSAPTVQLFDAAGAQRAQLRLNKDDVPSLRLYGSDGKIKSVVGFTLNDMQPTFVTFDANGIGHVENRTRPDAPFATVQDEDLTGGRYVQSYHGSTNGYSYATTTLLPPNSTWQYVTTQQAQASAEMARAQAEMAAQQARMHAAQARLQEELARQRAINAAADKVNLQVVPATPLR